MVKVVLKEIVEYKEVEVQVFGCTDLSLDTQENKDLVLNDTVGTICDPIFQEGWVIGSRNVTPKRHGEQFSTSDKEVEELRPTGH